MRLSLASVASYGTVITANAAEGTLQLLIPPYLERSGYPVATIGVLYALSFATALVCRVPAGILYRGSRARVLVAGAASVTAGLALLYLQAPGPVAFGALQIVHGAAYAVSTTVTLAHFLATIGEEATRGRALAYFASALSAGFMLGNSLGGLVADHWGFGGGFSTAALLALLGAPLAGALPAASAPPQPAGSRPGSGRGLRYAFGDPGLLYAGLVAFLLNFLYHVPGTFFPLYALAVGLGLGEVGFIRGAFALTNTAVRGLSGLVLERVGLRPTIAVGLLCHAAALALLPSFQTFLPLLALLLFVACWRAVVLVANTIGLAEEVNPGRVSRGLASGVFNAAQDLAGLVAPAIGGAVAAALGLENLFRVLPIAAVMVYFLASRAIGHPQPAAAPAESAGS
ncbi:MAG TPA: MFS transporter [Chloroflexota bacterium]|nr:MFS transporter [Chloroflexota bacterium]